MGRLVGVAVAGVGDGCRREARLARHPAQPGSERRAGQ